MSGSPPNTVDVSIGRNLAYIRERSGVTVDHVAGQLGIPARQVAAFEAGIVRVDAWSLFALRGVFNVSVAEFFSIVAGDKTTSETATVNPGA